MFHCTYGMTFKSVRKPKEVLYGWAMPVTGHTLKVELKQRLSIKIWNSLDVARRQDGEALENCLLMAALHSCLPTREDNFSLFSFVLPEEFS